MNNEDTKEIKVNEPVQEMDINENAIKNLIYVIRGQQVMLDSDLAMLYQVETKRVNEGVKRNSKRFPKIFCFQLSEEEFFNLKSQFATSSLEGKMDMAEKENFLMYSQNKELPCFQPYYEVM